MDNLKEKMIKEGVRKLKHHLDIIKSILENIEYQTEDDVLLSDMVMEIHNQHCKCYRTIQRFEFETLTF